MAAVNPKLTMIALALVVVLTSPVIPVAQDAQANGHDVHPGDQMSTGSSSCTVNFVFDGVGAQAGNVYFGTAAHCVSSVGQGIAIGGTNNFAEVAYIHPGGDLADDFAFLRVDPAHAHRVQAEVKGHPGTPTGSTTTADTGLGDLLLFSGYGMGYSITAITRESRVGVLYNDNGDTYIAEAPIIFGDSGGPVVHESTGQALGIVSAIVAGCCVGPGVWIEGPTIEGALDKASANGFNVQLRTA